MSTKTIVLHPLDAKSIDNAIKEVNGYIKWVERCQKRFVEKLADAGFSFLQIYWNDIGYDGEHFETFECNLVNGRFELVADGAKVCFIEFGTGVTYNGGGSYPWELPPEVVGIGQYGHHLGKMKSWRYPGTAGPHGTATPDPRHPGYMITRGNPANLPMYYTTHRLKDEIVATAKEVFG